MIRGGTVTLIGAGPTGALLAILLQRRGLKVVLYETRPDPASSPASAGRSINLALADRGIHALRLAGVYDAIAGSMMPMRGRFIHQNDREGSLQPYGQKPNEVIYSISRHRLNAELLSVAAGLDGVDIHFEHSLEQLDFERGCLQVRDRRLNRLFTAPMQPMLATDGAASPTRRRMSSLGLIHAEEADLEHGYKELTIPPDAGRHAMAHDALHIWPRGNFMLIALPNVDGSFTATLFLAKQGNPGFDVLDSPAAIDKFFREYFPDVHRLMPDCVAEFQLNPTGFLGTVYADPWHVGGMASLVGDAAHAIVPFHGQGMNCCLEDCVEFDACVQRNTTWASVFAEFYASRKPNTDAIAAMALENYGEMRERVAEPAFQLQQRLSLELERRHPHSFIPRYSMVMFHHEIPYWVAQQRGRIQAGLLADLSAGVANLADVDYTRADREINLRLTSLVRAS